MRDYSQNQYDRPSERRYDKKHLSRRPSTPRTGTRAQRLMRQTPDGSETWQQPWVQLKYFSYNPAIFPRMIGGVSPEAQPGDLINVYDKNGELFGAGFWNEQSRTPLRIVYHGKDIQTEADIEESLARAVKLRRETFKLDDVTNAYRVIHGDSDGIGGLIVDRYADVLSLEVSTLGVWQRLPKWLPILHKLCGTSRHVIHADESVSRMEGFDLRDAVPSAAPVRLVKIQENGVTFEVDFAQGHKTGFFCDQRDNRLKLSTLVKDAEVLDLCCYSGGFSIMAKLLGGAREVTAVDLDEKAIAMAKRNANINGQQRIDFVHADAFTYVRQMVRNGKMFDVVLLDPPKFVQGRDEEDFEEGIKKYHDLNMLGLQCVRPGGLLVTCSCSGLLNPGEFERTVIKAAQRQGRKLQIIAHTGPGFDHPYLSTYPEGRYLKVLWAIVL